VELHLEDSSIGTVANGLTSGKVFSAHCLLGWFGDVLLNCLLLWFQLFY
jgi:hypothetical protein